MPNVKRLEPVIKVMAKRKRVAAYARVSVSTSELIHSLATQVDFYSNFIQSNPEWEYAGVYADQGITGTSMDKREEFKRLLADCRAGKIDIVLVKSISRFARNTVDCLKVTRELKGLGIEVIFEREQISSMSNDGELLLTLLASFAQEESRSISENVKWGIRKNFQEGIPNGHKDPFGYIWNGESFDIVPEEAEIVKRIFKRYLEGQSAYRITKDLKDDGILGREGVPISESTVKYILSNISYTGPMILQKWYIAGNHKRKKNRGQLPMYQVEEMFDSIIGESSFAQVQRLRNQRAQERTNRNIELTVFSGKVRCGFCGRSVSRRTAKDKKKWVCNTRERKGVENCDLKPLFEEELKTLAAKALGIEEFADVVFEREVKRVEVYNERLDFVFYNGRVKKVNREYKGVRRRNGFSGKIKCGGCMEKFESDTWKFKEGNGRIKKKVWKCKSKRDECDIPRLLDEELRKATRWLFKNDNYESMFAEHIKEALVYKDRIEFHYKEGAVRVWQRE